MCPHGQAVRHAEVEIKIGDMYCSNGDTRFGSVQQFWTEVGSNFSDDKYAGDLNHIRVSPQIDHNDSSG